MSELGSGDFLGAFGVLEREGAILLARNSRVLVTGSAPVAVFDLPGGRVESGETLVEALRREWLEECALEIEPGALLFVQEGTRDVGGKRTWCWRSFFFDVGAHAEPRPGNEIDALLWCPRHRLSEVLHAPYHAGFLRWLTDGATFEQDEWRDV